MNDVSTFSIPLLSSLMINCFVVLSILIFNSSTLTPNVTYNTSGTFTYSLEATNICGNNIIMDSIVVSPDVFVDAGTNQAACLNTVLDLNGVISGGTTSGVWSANVSGGFLMLINIYVTVNSRL